MSTGEILTTSPNGLLQPLRIPSQIWTDIALDFTDGLPPSHSYTVILVVVDRLSKCGHFLPLSHPYTAVKVAELFFNNILRLHGLSTSIVSDRDTAFTSKFWQELFKLQGTKLHMSSSYHPQSDGQTEVLNRTLEIYLRCFAAEKPKSWSRWLALA